jgi:hypothetical protein
VVALLGALAVALDDDRDDELVVALLGALAVALDDDRDDELEIALLDELAFIVVLGEGRALIVDALADTFTNGVMMIFDCRVGSGIIQMIT